MKAAWREMSCTCHGSGQQEETPRQGAYGQIRIQTKSHDTYKVIATTQLVKVDGEYIQLLPTCINTTMSHTS